MMNKAEKTDGPVHYPDDVVVVPPLPRSQRNAKNITGMCFPQFSTEEDYPGIVFSQVKTQ